jgi:hypothetical protein
MDIINRLVQRAEDRRYSTPTQTTKGEYSPSLFDIIASGAKAYGSFAGGGG